MLIRFAVTNLFSFKAKAEFSMLASHERIHPHHVYRTRSRNHPNLLRTAVIYGANAAGKSNLVKAIKLLRRLVVTTSKPETHLPIQRFRLASECEDAATQFEIEFRAGNMNYLYTIAVTPAYVQTEQLAETTHSGENLVFARTTHDDGSVTVDWGRFFNKLPKKEQLFLEFVAKGTRPNQLLLRESIERNVNHFRGAYNWFHRSLHVIEPSTAYRALEARLEVDEQFRDFVARVLKTAGTGIADVRTQNVDLDTLTDIPEEVMAEIREKMSPDQALTLYNSNGVRFFLINEDGHTRAFKLTTTHTGDNSDVEASFDIHEESDGTQRLFDLVPMLYDLTIASNKERVYIIDEIGRSLHPHLTHMIFKMHLQETNKTQPSQLIATTHETNLLDLEFLRRDELWFVEKRVDGSTDLYSLADFQPRYDKDIQKDYLLGRYGGIPFIGNTQRLRLPIHKQARRDDAPLEA